jgi:murein DD-endopeptidase MepM/ murein hydrolase activator NlpD
MQQRYYDPLAGRFLSVDPVTTDAKTGRSFNRYAYAESNPYRYIDPDGRDTNPVTGESRILDRDLRTNASNPNVGKFGFTRSATNWNKGFHGGVDLKAPVGTDLKAPISGVVTATKDFDGSKEGNMVTISGSGDDKNVSVSMMHLSGMSVKSGDKISEGQVIGKSGDSGNAKGLPGAEAHVHMSVKVEGKTVDPQAHFNRQKENY